MKRLALLSSLLCAIALAAPPAEEFILHSGSQQVILQGGVSSAIFDEAETWFDAGREFVREQGVVYERVSHADLDDAYHLRVKSGTPSTLCDSTVKQHSGYMDISHDKHLFFWFFESRNSPAESPLVLWLNGGPGCSSSTGLMFELGPCTIAEGGESTVPNNHSWTNRANMIFLDQPVNVGYSYSSSSDDGSGVDTSPVAAADVWSFLELFLKKFPEYSILPFHIAAESYGGTYAPHIASVIHKRNQDLALAPVPNALTHIPLASVIIANGLTEPLTQFAAVPEFACKGPYPIWKDPDGPECKALRKKAATCSRLTRACYTFNSRVTCTPATLYCWSQVWSATFRDLGLNPYDVRRACNPDTDGALCYKQLDWIDTYLDKPAVKAALGAAPRRKFEGCNDEVGEAFLVRGDAAHNAAALLPPLLEDGIRLLVYAGNADFLCNFIGTLEWMLKLEKNPFHEEFRRANNTPWVTLDGGGRVAGEVRVAGSGAGNFTYAAVYEAGHMAPHDQPEAMLDLFTRWISNTPLTFASNVIL